MPKFNVGDNVRISKEFEIPALRGKAGVIVKTGEPFYEIRMTTGPWKGTTEMIGERWLSPITVRSTKSLREKYRGS